MPLPLLHELTMEALYKRMVNVMQKLENEIRITDNETAIDALRQEIDRISGEIELRLKNTKRGNGETI